MKKRLLSVILIFVLVFSDCGVIVAEESEGTTSEGQVEVIEEDNNNIDKLEEDAGTNTSEETSENIEDDKLPANEKEIDNQEADIPTVEENTDGDKNEKNNEKTQDAEITDSNQKETEVMEEDKSNSEENVSDTNEVLEKDNSLGISLYAAGNPYSGGYANCTYAAWQLCYEDTGHALPAWSNAITWYNSAAAAGYTVSTTPREKSIAVWSDSGYGHVGYVTAVSGSQIYVKEGGYDGGYHEGWLPASGYRNSYQKLVGYIYIPVDRTDYVNLGTNFKALIIRTDIWRPIVLDGTNVVLSSKEEGIAKEQWIFNRQSDGSYIIKSCYSGNVLDVTNAGTTEGTNVGTYSQWGTDNGAQRWYIFNSGSAYMLVPKCAKNLCMDVANGSTAGGANIQLWSQNNTGAQIFSIYKLDYNEPTSISINTSTNSLNVGDTLQLSYTITPSDARHKSVTWSSSNTGVATVDQTGKVTGVKEGAVSIICSTKYNDKISTRTPIIISDPTLNTSKKPDLKVVSSAYNKLKLSWNKLENADGYIIYRATSSNGNYKTLKKIESGNTLTYTDSGLTTNKSYYYKIRAYQKINGSSSNLRYGAYSSAKSGKPVPAAPGNVSVKSANYNSVKISWNTVSGANGYMIFRSTSSNGSYTAVKTINSGSTLSCTDGGLTTNKTYYYKVKAFRWVNGSRVYGSYSAVKSGKPVPAAPGNVSVKSANYNSVKISWSAVGGASGYMVFRSTSSNGTYSAIKTISSGSTLSCSDSGLLTGKVYYYKVKAFRWVNGSRVYGSYSTAKSGKSSLPTTNGLSIKSAGYDSLKISWSAVSGASGYMVYRATEKNGTFSAVKTINSGSSITYTDSGLTINRTYYYKVKAYRWVNGTKVYGNFGTIKSGKPVLSVPSGFSVKSAAYNSLKVSWNAVSGASGYVVYRSTSSTGTYSSIKTITNGNTVSYTNTGLTTNKAYYYKVKAYRWVDGKKVYGSFCSAKSGKPIPSAPNNLEAVSTGNNSAKISWKSVAGASGYMIFRASSKSGSYSTIKTITSGSTVSYTNTNLTNNKTYFYKVRAYRWVNGTRVYSNYSSVVQITIGKFKSGNFYYTINSNNNAVIDGYIGKESTVTVPAKINEYTVEGINAYGMLPSSNEENTTMQQVVLPSSLKWISSMSFIYCKKLKEVKIPDGVKWIGNNAFFGCVSLVKITIPKSVTQMYGDIAQECSSTLTYYVYRGSYADSYLKSQSKKIVYI